MGCDRVQAPEEREFWVKKYGRKRPERKDGVYFVAGAIVQVTKILTMEQTMQQPSFDKRVCAPEGVLVRELDGESVLLNLESETYFGLDEVGTRMWALLTAAPSIQAAYEALLVEYDVAPERLRQDLETLVAQLVDNGLLTLDA